MELSVWGVWNLNLEKADEVRRAGDGFGSIGADRRHHVEVKL